MSNYTQEEQTQIVKTMMNLTAAIQIEECEVSRLKAEHFRSKPNPPERKTVPQPAAIKPKIPSAPKTNYSYSEFIKETKNNFLNKYKKRLIIAVIIIVAVVILFSILNKSLSQGMGGILTPFVGFIGLLFPAAFFLLIATYLSYCKKRKQINDKLSNTPDYLKAVEDAKKAAEAENKKIQEKVQIEQQKLDKEYENQMADYDNSVIPEYNKELQAWQDLQYRKIKIIEEDIKINSETLKNTYDTTKLISATYRELWILRWLYNDMSTSDHDIRYATELLDRDRQRLVTQEAGMIMQNAISELDKTMQEGFAYVYDAIENGNEVNEKMLRDMRIAGGIGLVQNHKRNKLLGDINEKLN